MTIDTKEILKRQKIGLWTIEMEEGKPTRLFVDEVMADLMGITEDLSPEEIYEFWGRGTDVESARIMMDATEQMISGEYAEAQYVWMHPDGNPRTVRCGGSRDYSCTEFIRLLGSHRDITSLIHLDEAKINRDRNIINRYLDTAKFALIVNLAKDTYTTLKSNPENESVIHFEESGCYSDLIRKYISTFVYAPNVRSMMEIADPQSLNNRFGKDESLKISFQKKVDSYYRWYQFSANKLSADEVFVTFHDADRQIRTQMFWEALSTQMLFGFVIDLKTNMVTVTKRSSMIQAFSGLDQLGYSTLVSMVENIMDDEFREDWMKFSNIEKLRSVSRESRRADFSFTTHATGSLMWVRTTLSPLEESEGGGTLALSFYQYTRENLEKMKRDEEYRKALEEVHFAQEANRLKTTFVQNISHDIRTPLNAIVGFSQLLSMPDGFLDDVEKGQYAEYIRDSADLLTMIVNDVLSMSDVEKGILNISMVPSSCNEICRKSVNCSTMRTPSGVKMYYSSEVSDDFTIDTDPMRVQQILVNFLSNACKHTTEGEIHVHCSAKETPGKITFSVTDTGEGIPDGIAEDIFARFTTMDTNKGGHGMGLNICQDLSMRLGGYVSLDRTYKKGARFTLVLPCKAE